MRRLTIFALGLALFSLPAFSQTPTTDSQTLQALLAEVHQLRQDLQALTAATQRGQILLYRLQVQQAAVARASQRLEDARSRLADTQSSRKRQAAQVKKYEEMSGHTGNPAEQKQIEEWLPRAKVELEQATNEEQDRQSRAMEAEELLRTEQARLGELQEQLDRLDKALERSGRQSGSTAR
ncbi:MAG: hypothetical protein LAO21_03965 [Acidobacteriia bacterium]|nr:hypothetical protein [Terriglobia bacterium]